MLQKPLDHIDRRQEERLPVRIRFDFRCDEGAIMFQGRTSDMSKSGLSFYCDFQLPHAKCEMDLMLPSRSHGEPHLIARVGARIAYAVLSGENGFRVGIEFKKFHGDAKTLICRELALCQLPFDDKDILKKNGSF